MTLAWNSERRGGRNSVTRVRGQWFAPWLRAPSNTACQQTFSWDPCARLTHTHTSCQSMNGPVLHTHTHTHTHNGSPSAMSHADTPRSANFTSPLSEMRMLPTTTHQCQPQQPSRPHCSTHLLLHLGGFVLCRGNIWCYTIIIHPQKRIFKNQINNELYKQTNKQTNNKP